MFAIVRVLPCVRALTKYQTRSFLIGPPNAPFRSYTFVQRRRRREAGVLERRREVVRLQLLAGAAEEQRPRTSVAAGLRHDVHHQAGGLRFAEAARRVNVTSCALPTSAM